ncbi:hypothetical protein CC1G_14339 [Coprinopsis cinerea okayama7|uniref:Uncharacterized protein n=1 Tax=Coprinopsis cinerea (strain Okayama-7 / 130 / ATCC MYA-4618 / FGSC 9003) TaxID=240176 RepID=D6RLX6_COPC7|nr:hypothetical protein CC1G_14339 [Coprinopsis cinerea okayama7\|eukprot:XP_002911341.1 hypothetical protein CC1G_14339 [Coprinopsis cinerea okayama7\
MQMDPLRIRRCDCHLGPYGCELVVRNASPADPNILSSRLSVYTLATARRSCTLSIADLTLSTNLPRYVDSIRLRQHLMSSHRTGT